MVALRVGTFGAASALPILAGQELGWFDRAGMEVQRSTTFDSAELRDGLTSGSLDIVHLGPDNVIAWADAGLDVRAWLAGSAGPISLVAREAARIADLRSARIGVDSPKSGFVPILRQLLANGGVHEDEVELVPLGATRLRYVAISDAQVDATMLTLPWSLLAVGSGGKILGDHTDVAPDLLTSCGASRSTWLDEQAPIARAYAQVLKEAVAWLRDPTHADRAAQLLAEPIKQDVAVAHEVLAVMRDESRGWPAEPRLQGPELRPNWDLRAATMGQPASAPEAYVQPFTDR